MFGKIVVGYFSFSNGEVFLTSHKNSSPDDILKNVSNVSWNEVLLNKLEINVFMKTNGEDSVIVIPPEEGSRYRLLKMVLRFNLDANKIESFLRQRFEKMVSSYKEIIKAIENHKPFFKNEVIILNSSILNPLSISYHLMKLIANEEGKNIGIMYSIDYGKVIEIIDHNDKVFVTVLPSKLIITRADPELYLINNTLLNQLENKYGIKDCVFILFDGLVCKTLEQNIPKLIDINMFSRRIDLNIIKKAVI